MNCLVTHTLCGGGELRWPYSMEQYGVILNELRCLISHRLETGGEVQGSTESRPATVGEIAKVVRGR